MTEYARFQRVLNRISEFFAMDDPQSPFNRVMADLMETCPGGVIVGGMAVSFYVKNPRTTKDVDIAFANENPLPAEFHRRFELVPDKPMTARHRETDIEVDLLNPANPVVNSRLLAEVARHVNLLERAGRTIRVARPEFIIALKLHRAQNRTGAGLQDRTDIVNILTDNPGLDLGVVRPHLSEDERDLLDDLMTYREALISDQTHD